MYQIHYLQKTPLIYYFPIHKSYLSLLSKVSKTHGPGKLINFIKIRINFKFNSETDKTNSKTDGSIQ